MAYINVRTLFMVAVSNNRSLRDLDGLKNITEVGRGLQIAGNELLENLDGLVNVNRIGLLSGKSGRNAILSECKGIAPVLGNILTVAIYGLMAL